MLLDSTGPTVAYIRSSAAAEGGGRRSVSTWFYWALGDRHGAIGLVPAVAFRRCVVLLFIRDEKERRNPAQSNTFPCASLASLKSKKDLDDSDGRGRRRRFYFCPTTVGCVVVVPTCPSLSSFLHTTHPPACPPARKYRPLICLWEEGE